MPPVDDWRRGKRDAPVFRATTDPTIAQLPNSGKSRGTNRPGTLLRPYRQIQAVLVRCGQPPAAPSATFAPRYDLPRIRRAA